jgi:NADPH:quinone reductase-like Zn-dependent oxidoreductase
MKAVRIHEHGGPEKLIYETVDDPKPSPLEVVVRVKACAMNHLDIWVREGMPGMKANLPHILGCDISGVVEEVGSSVTGVKKGDETLVHPGVSCGVCEYCLKGMDSACRSYTILGGWHIDGGYAELVKVPGRNILPKPKGMDFVQAAALPLSYLTVWHMLVTRANIKPGETVLVLSAGSGVGVAAVQVAKLFGARVIATASADWKLEKVRALGADETINYKKVDWLEEVKRLTGKAGVDVVFEHVGPETFEKSVRALKTYGRLVTCGATSGPSINLDLRFLFSKQLNLLGSYMGGLFEMKEALKFINEGKLRPVVDSTFPLKDAAKAHEKLASREIFGKVVITP